MQIRRRKKNGKFVGNWFWGDVNLETKDATLAKARARLVDQGKWPPDDPAAASVEEGLAGAGDDQPDDAESTDDTPPPAPGPQAPPAPPARDTPDGDGGPAPGGDGAEGPTSDAWAEAAAEAAGSSPEEIAQARADGVDLGQEMADAATGLVASAPGLLARLGVYIGTRKRKPPLRLQLPEVNESSKAFALTRVSLDACMRRWAPSLAHVNPGWGLVGGALLCFVGQLRDAKVVAVDPEAEGAPAGTHPGGAS